MMMGLEGMYWFVGVVEDRNDPEKRGRVRVRLWALHSKEKQINEKTGQGIPTDDLPWATPIRPITSAAMDGIGNTPLGLVEGTWVVGFARDGDVYNDLLILGSIGGRPEDAPKDNNGKDGFVDPRSEGEISGTPRYINKVENRDPSYPGQGIPQGRYPQEKWLNEVDVNRLARGEKLDETLLKPKRIDRERRIKTAFGSYWDEMSSPYSAKYPFNHVFESESGHVMEFDDTKDAERWHLWHKDKTYIEIHPKGAVQLKTQKDFFTVTRGDIHTYAEADHNLTAKNSVGILAKRGDVKIKTDTGDFIVDAKGEINMIARGNNSVHITAEAGPMIARTGVGSMLFDSMTGITTISNTGSITTAAPLGGITSVATGNIQMTSALGNAGMSALTGAVNMDALVGSVGMSGMTGVNLASIAGGITGLAQQSVTWTSMAGQVAFVSTLGRIIATAQTALTLLSLTGDMLMQAGEGNIAVQTLGPDSSFDLDSSTSIGIATVEGSIGIKVPEDNLLGTSISGPKPLELKSLENVVSIASATMDVNISADLGAIALSALSITLEADTLDITGDNISFDSVETLQLNSGTSLGTLSTTSTNLVSTTTFDINSGEALTIQSGSTLDITSADDMTLDVTGNLIGAASGILDITSDNFNINGTTLSIDVSGNVEIVSGVNTITMSGSEVLIKTGSPGFGLASISLNAGVVTINSDSIVLPPGPGYLDSYGVQLRDLLETYFNGLYAPI